MKELESWGNKPEENEPACETPAPAPVAEEKKDDLPDTLPDTTPIPDSRPMTRYEELCRKPSMSLEAGDVSVMTDLSEIIARVNEAARYVERLQKEHPNFMPERFLNLWINNLRDTSQVMMREFHALRNGRQQKKYDKRCICAKCNGVFLTVLPGGVCDECRASKRSAPRNS
jgi:hypothetical protein